MGIPTKNALPQLLADPLIAGDNAGGNGDFDEWRNYEQGVTTESVGTPPGSLPTHWYGGPGGAIATYDRIPVSAANRKEGPVGPWAFRVAWSKPQSDKWPGETHHAARIPLHVLGVFRNFRRTEVRREECSLELLRSQSEGKSRDRADSLAQLRRQHGGDHGRQRQGVRALRGIGPVGQSRDRPGLAPAGGQVRADATLATVREDHRATHCRRQIHHAGSLYRCGVRSRRGAVSPTIDLADIEVREVRK